MEESSSGHEAFSMDNMNAELAEAALPRKRKHPDDDHNSIDSDDSDDSIYASSGIEMEDSLPRCPKMLPQLGTILAECEVRRRKCLKRRRREHGPDALVDERLYDPDDENSNSSMNMVRGRADHALVDHAEPTSSSRSMQLSKRSEKVEICSWLLVSSVKNGWSYERVKNYLMRKHNIKTIKSKTQQIGTDEENRQFFQAVVKFQNKDDMNRVVEELVRRRVYNKFIFFSFDDMPVSFYDSDSEEETERRGPWMRLPKEV